MRPEPSVHDNFVYAYTVDCEGPRLTLHTAYRDREPHEFTDVVFRDVVTHHFEHVLPGNILMDVEEVDVTALIRENGRLLADPWRWGWPLPRRRHAFVTAVPSQRALRVQRRLQQPGEFAVVHPPAGSSARSGDATRHSDITKLTEILRTKT
jgi:hypothetical protein